MMVMFATATTASLKKTNDVVIMLKNHERALHVNAGGKVTATDISLAQFFSMESVGDIFSDTFKIALYAKEVGRYLCFRRGKLVGMKNLTRDCHFIESLDHGYFLYANAYNPLWRVGFTKGLKPVGPRHWKRPQTLKRACFLFVKINAEHFDRSRFTTTTTTAAPTTKAAVAVTLWEGQKLHDSKASIIDSNSNNYKKTKSANNSENVNATRIRSRQWPDRDATRRRHRKRKHHAKLSAAQTNGGNGLLQPKNLIRHHHNQGNGEGRRRQHQREEKERKLRLKNQRRQQQQQQEKDNTDSEPMPNATNSASPSVAATTVAATASLAPSALNIVAMLAAGRRKRGRRKKPNDTSVTSLSTNSGHNQAMDLQLVAQSPLQAQNQYDRLQVTGTKIHGHRLRHHHEHNYHQKHQQNIAPVNSASPSNQEANKVQQQNHKYSNINTDSQLYSRRSSSPRNTTSSSKNSNNLSHNFNFNLNLNHNVNNVNANVNYDNINNNNNNDKINAIPALPKTYLSKSNFNHKYLMQQTTTSATDFNTKQQQFSHSSHSSRDPKQIQPSDHSHTSHNYYQTQQKVTSDNDDNDYNYDDSDSDNDNYNYNYSDDSYRHENNSNRLLVNNSNNNNISDNNLQQEHLINRFKLIYLDRIRSHKFFNFNLHANNKSNSPISSTTNIENHLNFENIETQNDFSAAYEFQAKRNSSNSNNSISNSSNSGNISSSIKNVSSSVNTTTTTSTSYNNLSHKRTKRNLIIENITNNNNNNMHWNKEIKDYNNVYAKNNSNANNSNSSNTSRGSITKIINWPKYYNNGNKINSLAGKYLKSLIMPSTTASRNSKLLKILERQHILKQQQIIELINNPNYNNYNDYDYDNDDKDNDDGGKLKRIQNKYEKIIVQYRSVFNCLEN